LTTALSERLSRIKRKRAACFEKAANASHAMLHMAQILVRRNLPYCRTNENHCIDSCAKTLDFQCREALVMMRAAM